MEFLRGKTAIVTGAAGGIGEAISKKLAELGMNLVITGRKAQSLEELAAQLPTKVHCCVGDLQELSFVDRLLAETKAQFGSVDVIINNAGLSHNCPVEEMTPELFDSIMRVNVRAPYFLCQKAVEDLKKSDCATIINICSVVAHKGYPRQSVYKDNIRVHVISPGSVYTKMIAMVRPDLSPEGMILPEDIADIVGMYLMLRKSNAVVDEIEVHRVTKEPFA